MAHFAEIDENNIVIRVLVTDNKDPNGDEGYEWLLQNLGGTWKRASYNTDGGVHSNGGVPFRKNFPSPGFVYDLELNAFRTMQPFQSWTLDKETCKWAAPTPYPNDDKQYEWNESTLSWDKVTAP